MCTGNICRSPFIERLLQAKLDAHRESPSQPDILVRSAGTGAVVGSAMDERAAAQLVLHGGDPAGFRGRDLTPALIAESDLILTATREHRGKVASMYPKALRQVFTFRDFADLVTHLDNLAGSEVAGLDNLAGSEVAGVDFRGVDVPSALGGQANSRARVRELTERAAASRGLNPPLEPGRADIVDPFRREDELFATMAQQIVGSMPAVVRALSQISSR